MRKVLLDTNFIQSYINEEDKLHLEARKLFSNFPEGTKFIIPAIVVVELIIGTDQINRVYEFCSLLCNTFESIELDDINLIAQINIEARRSLKSTDCLILAVCVREDADLITFDQR